MHKTDSTSNARAWAFVPMLYFLEGLPNVLVATVSVTMYKKLGISNEQIGLWTSLIALPWTLKMLWAPLVDTTLTKRIWVVLTQILLIIGLAAVAQSLTSPSFFVISLSLLGVLALVSATHDVAADGFYLLALDEKQQAFFVGIRSTFYRLAAIFAGGWLVFMAGTLEVAGKPMYDEKGNVRLPTALESAIQSIDPAFASLVSNQVTRSWVIALFFAVAVFALVSLINSFVMPRPARDAPADKVARDQPPFLEAFRTFFKQPKIFWILGFVLFYRFGESMIGKMSAPFLLDSVEKGGLGVTTAQQGIMSGLYGVLALLAGGISGGMLISKFGIKKCLWPMVLAMNVPNLFYVWAAMAQPSLTAVKALIMIDQFGYGFGFSAYMVYLMFIAQGDDRYKTSRYAIATGLMALGAMIAGATSGYLQTALGYRDFFIAVCLLTIPGMITLLFIPLDRDDIREASSEL